MGKRKPPSLENSSKRSRPDPTDALESFMPSSASESTSSKASNATSATSNQSSSRNVSTSNKPKALSSNHGAQSHLASPSPSADIILKNLLNNLPQNDEETASYFATLLKAASRRQGVEKQEPLFDLNKDENLFLQELDEALEPPKLPNNGEIAEGEEDDFDEDEEDEINTKMGDGRDDSEDGRENMMPARDITKHRKKNPAQPKRGRKPKVLLKEFENEDLALLAKRCARMGTCILNMFPDNKLFSWALFSDTLKAMAAEGSADDMVRYLKQISSDRNKRKDLVTFMSYGPSSIRFDIGKEVRIRVTQHFGIPGNMSQEQISSAVTWLIHNRRFHEGDVDIHERTTNGLPFQTTLIGGILRGYFIDGKPSQDELLVAYLKSQRKVPLALIAMVVTLIGNAIQEYAIGYKQLTVLSAANLGFHYTAIVKTLRDLKLKTPAYYEFLQTKLWQEMNTAAPEIVPPQVYDYEALTAFANAAKNGKGNAEEQTWFVSGNGKRSDSENRNGQTGGGGRDVSRKGKGKAAEAVEEEEAEEEIEDDVDPEKKWRRRTLAEGLMGEPTLILDGSPEL